MISSDLASVENLLTIVIISRNEARNIKRCIESVLHVAKLYQNVKVILVDSASTDETCAIARNYPISIVGLKPSWRLTASAGRFIGTTLTHSDYILFLDGDMVLNADWVKDGLGFLQSHPMAAAVSGDMDEIYWDDDCQALSTLYHRYNANGELEVKALGGAGLYLHAALNKCGTFNPFVPLREEAELALRLRHGGYKLYRIPGNIAVHYSPPRDTLNEVSRRYRAGYFHGFGRALYYSALNGFGWQFIREQGLAFISFAFYLFIGLICLIFLILGEWIPFSLWAGMGVIVFVAFSLKKKGVKKALIGLLSRALIGYGAVAGLLSAIHDPPEYPTDIIVIQS